MTAEPASAAVGSIKLAAAKPVVKQENQSPLQNADELGDPRLQPRRQFAFVAIGKINVECRHGLLEHG